MINVFKKFNTIIENLTVEKYDVEGISFRFICTVIFIDNSILNIREYFFEENNKRKYSYHWMDKKTNLLYRWDNSEHWKELKTFPHHVHSGSKDIVLESRVITIEDVLEFINKEIKI